MIVNAPITEDPIDGNQDPSYTQKPVYCCLFTVNGHFGPDSSLSTLLDCSPVLGTNHSNS